MKRLRELRESLRLTQEELAKSLNTTQQTIARWESGKSQPNISALKDLAVIFGTSVDDLLEYSKSGKKMYSATHWLIGKEHDGLWGHDDVLENYANEQLKKRENVDNFVDRAVDQKLVEAYKGIVKLNEKKVTFEEFNKLMRGE